MNSVQFDYMKFKEAVHVIAHLCDSEALGRVKLHKTLYFADMIQYVATGQPLTGATYRRQPKGPMASELGRALADLQREGALEISQQPYFGFWKDSFRSLRSPALYRFTESELALLEDVISFTCKGNSAKSISEISHTAAWEAAGNGEVVPYSQAILMFDSDDYDDAAEWALAEEKKLASGTAQLLGPEAVVDFRARLLGRRSAGPPAQ